MADDGDTSDDEEDLFGDGDNVDSPGTFGFLANQTSDTFNDDEELLPDAAQYSNSTYMAPSDAIIANQLLTSHESISAYKLQKSVKISENAPILFTDISNNNEPIINHNKLLSTIDISLPKSIILYSSKEINDKLYKKDSDNNSSNDDDDELLYDSHWHKQFSKKTELTKQNVLQNNNIKYKNLKFEYDKYNTLNTIKNQDTINKLVNNCHGNIEIKPTNNFEHLVEQLQESHPSLFEYDNNNELNNLSENEQLQLKQLLIAQNLIQLIGYNDNECELLAVNPENININNNVNLSQLIEYNQCNFDHEIIIDDGIIDDNNPNNIQNNNNHNDIQMEDKTIANNTEHNIIEMKMVKKKVGKDTFLKAKYETTQKMNKLNENYTNDNNNNRKRKNRGSDDECLLFQAKKRQKISSHKHIKFKIKTRIHEYESMKVNKNKNQSSYGHGDEDLDLLLPDDMNNDEEEYDDDAIGDDLFDMMPDIEEDWNGNNDKHFGVVQDEKEIIETIPISEDTNPQEMKQEIKPEIKEEIKEEYKLPLLKCAVNNSSIWPNKNMEYENCQWLDSVIISDKIKPKREMNTNLIIDLNDYRMEWTEEFIKSMNKYKNMNDKMGDKMNEKEKSASLETVFNPKKWNLSNDSQYTFADISHAQKRNLHTPMAYNLDKEIFPQIANIDEWVGLHRKQIKLNEKVIKITLSNGNSANNNNKKDLIRHKYSMYIPKNWSELSARTDRIILLEYLEEYPLIIQSIGMTSNIITLYRKSQSEYDNNEAGPNIAVSDGIVKFLNPREKSALLGAPRQTKWVTILENKLYATPIWCHTNNILYDLEKEEKKDNIFMLIGYNHTYFIRKIDAIFAIGQIQPKQVVYHPGSRQFRSYMHDRCKVHIYKLLQNKKQISVQDIVRDFPLETEDAIKDQLRTVAEHDKTMSGYWIRKSDFLTNRSDLEIQQMVKPEQEVLRQMFMNCYCRLYNDGISAHLIGGTRGGGWKRVLKNLVFNKDLLDNIYSMKKELEHDIIEYENANNNNDEEKNNINPLLLLDINPNMKLKALQLIEELLFCTSWYLSDQFLRCYRGEGEMQLSGYGNPFKNNEGFNYLRDRDKTSSEAIKLMVASAGQRANTKADFRRMPMSKAILILKQRYLVPDIVLTKLDRRKIMELLQKKSRDALSAGYQNKTALRYARLTGSRKIYAKQQYMKKIKKLMKSHLLMLRGDIFNCINNGNGNNDNINQDNDIVEDLENLMMSQDANEEEKNSQPMKNEKKKKKLKCIKKYILRYTYCYNDSITGERKKEIIEYAEDKYPELLRRYRLCIKEGDKKFNKLRDYSKLYKQQQEDMDATGDDINTRFMNDRQKERYSKMQKIKNMPFEEREKILSKLELEKDYITCSSCKRKGHNSNNKYCPKYHENKEKRQQLRQQNNNGYDNEDDDDNGIDSFIDRAIDKKHKSYLFDKYKKYKKNKRNKNKYNNNEINDPRLNFIAVLKHIMDKAKCVNGSVTFSKDPTVLPGYCKKIKEPMCLNWIDENILYTEQCIKAPQANISIIRNSNGNNNNNKFKLPNKKQYKTFDTFIYDIKLIYQNSSKYNGQESNYTHLAWTIVEEVNSMQRQYKTVIDTLNIEVEQTYMINDLQPILNKLINGILDAPTLDIFKSLNNNTINNQNNQNQNIKVKGLYEIRQKVHDKHYQNFQDFVYDLKQLQQFCYDLNKQEFEKPIKILPNQFDKKLNPFKKSLAKIDADSVNHFKLNKKPPFI